MERNGADEADPGTISRLVYGHVAAAAVGAAVRLGVSEGLRDGPRDATALAARLGADAGATLRLLRALAGLGLLAEDDDGRFAPTATGALLDPAHPESMAAFAAMFTHPALTAGWDRLAESVRDGRPAHDAAFGTDLFAHLTAEPEVGALFNAAMRENTRAVATALVAAYDVSWAATVADVGGGDGALLGALLAATPGPRGLVFDTAAGAAQAPGVLAAAGVADRVDVVVGDFFTDAPTAEAYLLKSILHDWDDERCARILDRIRARIPAAGRVAVLDRVLPDRASAQAAPLYASDLNMLANLTGRERTAGEFDALLHRCGFTRVSTTPLAAGFSLVEAVPVT